MKVLVLTLGAILLGTVVHAQHFRHGVTTGTMVNFNNAPPYDEATVFTTVGYSPRFKIIEQTNTSFSVGLPLSFGFTTDIEDYFQYAFDIPLMFDFNWGAGAASTTKKRFGLLGGIGFGLNYANYYNTNFFSDEELRPYVTFGPSANLGMRFAVGRKQKNVEVKFSYGNYFSTPRPSFLSAVAGFNF